MGPTLYLTYINDLLDINLVDGRIISFALDTTLLFRGDSRKEAYSKAQKGSNNVSDWLIVNKLTLNTN